MLVCLLLGEKWIKVRLVYFIQTFLYSLPGSLQYLLGQLYP